MQITTRAELMQLIHESPRLKKLYQHIMQTDGTDPAHNSSHLLRVALFALQIRENSCDAEELIAAALLHDLVNVPKNHPDRSRASLLSAQAAEPLLQNFAPEAILRIQEAIRDHSFSRGATPTTPLAKTLQDADRLEAIGAIGLMRVFSTGVSMGAQYFHDSDPWARARELDDKKYSIDHFFTKLLKLPQSMTTHGGKIEAKKRVKIMYDFLDQLGIELGESAPKETP